MEFKKSREKEEKHDLASLKQLAALSKRSAASSYLEPNKPQPLSFFSAFFSNSSPFDNWSAIFLRSKQSNWRWIDWSNSVRCRNKKKKKKKIHKRRSKKILIRLCWRPSPNPKPANSELRNKKDCPFPIFWIIIYFLTQSWAASRFQFGPHLLGLLLAFFQ